MKKKLVFAFICLAFIPAAAHAGAPEQRKLTMGAYIEEVSDTLGVEINFVSEPSLDTQVIEVPKVSGPEPLMEQFLAVLAYQGFALIPQPELGGYQLLRQRDARDRDLPLITDADKLPDSDQLVTFVMHVKDISAEGMARTMRSFMPATSRIIPIEATRTLIITDSARGVRKAREIVMRLDRPLSASDEAEAKREAKANECPPPHGRMHGPGRGLIVAIFSLLGLILGFLLRGYLIRRVEGGL